MARPPAPDDVPFHRVAVLGVSGPGWSPPFGLSAIGRGSSVALTHPAFAATNHPIAVALGSIVGLSVVGVGIVMSGEVLSGFRMLSDEPATAVISRTGHRRATGSGVQGAFQLVSIVGVVYQRRDGFCVTNERTTPAGRRCFSTGHRSSDTWRGTRSTGCAARTPDIRSTFSRFVWFSSFTLTNYSIITVIIRHTFEKYGSFATFVNTDAARRFGER